MAIHAFIGECNEEYRNRQQCEREEGANHYSAYAFSKPNKRPDKRKFQAQNAQAERCTHCGRDNHKVENCYHASKPKCPVCKRLGHIKEKCRFKGKYTKSQKQKEKQVPETATDKKETNVAETGVKIDSDIETLVAIDASENMMIEDDPFVDDIDMYLASSADNDDASRVYDWLADSGSTHHITNRREFFQSYEPTPDATVHGVGGAISEVKGRGSITLNAQHGKHMRTLILENVNYIPSNKYNIFALGRWDNKGRKYQASDGELTLFDRKGIPVISGPKIASNIYKFRLKPNATIQNNKNYAFSCAEPKQNWETWHRRFGHVSYKGLRKLYNDKLVDGYTVDKDTPTLACESCTEAKQSVKPFPKDTEHAQRQKGELTHIDLWGKYDIASINGKQYYLLLVDDATRYVTVYFLKAKHEASQLVKNYLAYLHLRGISTHSIRVDRGTEFINKNLQEWCHEKGMEV